MQRNILSFQPGPLHLSVMFKFNFDSNDADLDLADLPDELLSIPTFAANDPGTHSLSQPWAEVSFEQLVLVCFSLVIVDILTHNCIRDS
jgi:hypothetical protein